MEPEQYKELIDLLHRLLKNQAAATEQANLEIEAAERKIQRLQTRLASATALLAAKDETITLLRASYGRPN